jgi:LysR family transcriptional regulator for bpeEF and oprC
VETTIALGRELIVPRLPEFSARYPDISLTVTLTNQMHNLIERGVDVALRVAHVEDADLVARAVTEMEYYVCATPELAKTAPASPAQLNPRRCIGITQEGRHAVIPWELAKDGETAEIHPDGPLHFNTGADVLVAARAGAGFGCVLDVLAIPYLANGSLVRLYEGWHTPTKNLYVVMPRSRVGWAKVKVFTDFIHEVLDGQRRPSANKPIGVKTRGGR